VSLVDDQRGVELADVMSHGARIFSPALSDTPALYARSRPVARFHFFVSHSWSASRWDKYVGLLYRFNLVPALFAMHLASLLACALFVAGVLPPMATLGYALADDLLGVRLPSGAYCQLAGTAAFVAVLLGWDRLVALAEAAGLAARRDCFVDKMCIDQADDAKARGIDQIGRFLRNSEELLILWSPDYFSRLWCCFEIAVFLHFQQTGTHAQQQQRKISLVPLLLAKNGFLIAAIYTLGTLAFRLMTLKAFDWVVDSNIYIALGTAAALCCSVPMSVLFRTFARQRGELNRQLLLLPPYYYYYYYYY
jgi:hypothetical protein